MIDMACPPRTHNYAYSGENIAHTFRHARAFTTRRLHVFRHHGTITEFADTIYTGSCRPPCAAGCSGKRLGLRTVMLSVSFMHLYGFAVNTHTVTFTLRDPNVPFAALPAREYRRVDVTDGYHRLEPTFLVLVAGHAPMYGHVRHDNVRYGHAYVEGADPIQGLVPCSH